MQPIPDERLAQIKMEAEKYYKSIGDVYCPYFLKPVSFNSKGLFHIEFKEWKKLRGRTDQYFRLRLLKLAPEIIRLSHTLQGIRETHCEVREKRNGSWKRQIKRVTYYEFIHVKNNTRVRIILKQLEGGELHFWSLVPFWKQSHGKKMLHSGDPERD